MASGKSNYLSNKLLNQIFNGAAYSFPPYIWCGLFTSAPSAVAGSGTELTIGSFGYNRVQIQCITANFATTSTQTITNTQAIIFGTCQGTAWGTINAAAFFDASTGGNMLYFGTLTTSVTVAVGNTFEFLANNFTVQES